MRGPFSWTFLVALTRECTVALGEAGGEAVVLEPAPRSLGVEVDLDTQFTSLLSLSLHTASLHANSIALQFRLTKYST